jgi:hypothetical protein
MPDHSLPADTSGHAHLITERLIDCFGATTHELTLDYNGTVSIRFAHGGPTVRIDPSTRTVLTPGAMVPDQIMDHAAAMRVG